MSENIELLVHYFVTLLNPGGVKVVMAESIVMKQLLIVITWGSSMKYSGMILPDSNRPVLVSATTNKILKRLRRVSFHRFAIIICAILLSGQSIGDNPGDTGSAPSGRFKGDLIHLIPSLYGGDGITLDSAASARHSAHFLGGSLEELDTLAGAMASTSQPSIALQSSAVFIYDEIMDDYIELPASRDASALVEGASVIGVDRWGFNISAVNQRFKEFNGKRLSSTIVNLKHRDIGDPGTDHPCIGGPPDACYKFELDKVELTIDIEFEVSTIYFQSSYGVTNNTEIGITVPYHKTQLQASSTARIIEGETSQYFGRTLHAFGGDADPEHSELHGEHNGVGDIIIRSKTMLAENNNFKFAIAASTRLPTGASEHLQGIPGIGLGFDLFFENQFDFKKLGFKPHLKLGYKANAGINHQHNFGYSFGTNIVLNDVGEVGMSKLGFSLDIIGERTVKNKNGFADKRHDFVFGSSWRTSDDLSFAYNLLVPLDDDGIRAHFVHLVELRFEF